MRSGGALSPTFATELRFRRREIPGERRDPPRWLVAIRDRKTGGACSHRLSLGWRMSEESFLKNVSWLNDLKLRVAYGQTGNNDLGNYSYVGQVGISDYINNNALASGRTLNTLGNANLGWEKTRGSRRWVRSRPVQQPRLVHGRRLQRHHQRPAAQRRDSAVIGLRQR